MYVDREDVSRFSKLKPVVHILWMRAEDGLFVSRIAYKYQLVLSNAWHCSGVGSRVFTVLSTQHRTENIHVCEDMRECFIVTRIYVTTPRYGYYYVYILACV
ncbi:hypothetical protein KQX54_007182 [Cotesia glomerata]|uniref:Uncharacterized protein n=1 Tax=Cotesia glomerata TaxID=32391 RepID=A0AAV7HYZ7_COTGL|nr:hypothetical protein KQX54_007182 [Cotesia glomerata]